MGSKSSMSMMWSLGRRTWKARTSYSRSMISRPRSSRSVELGGEELLEAHDRDAAALVEEGLDLGQEAASWLARMTSPEPRFAIASIVR